MRRPGFIPGKDGGDVDALMGHCSILGPGDWNMGWWVVVDEVRGVVALCVRSGALACVIRKGFNRCGM